MSGKESDKRKLASADPGRGRPAVRFLARHAPGVIKTALYLGLTYVALFVGVSECQGQSGCWGNYWEHAWLCNNGSKDYCTGSPQSDCQSRCAGYVPCKGIGVKQDLTGGCIYIPLSCPDSLSASASVNCSMGGGGWCRAPASLYMSATDSAGHAVSFTGSIGGAGFSCGNPCTQNIPEGQGTYSWTATCSGGLTVSEGPIAYKVDGTPPVLVASLSGGAPGLRGWYVGGTVTLNCSASDSLSGLASLNYGNQSASSQGTTTLSCTATDVAGNSADASYSVGIDSGTPMLDTVYSGTRGHSGWYISPVDVRVSASDGVSGIYSTGMRVDGGAWVSAATLTDGEHYIEARAEDNAGNVSTGTGYVKVDTLAPATAWSIDSGSWVRGKVTLKGVSSDAGSGIASVYLSFDGEEWKRIGGDAEWTYEWDTTQFPDGSYEILARADDAAGNEEHTASLTLKVDNTAPVVDMTKEWTAPAAGEAGGSDALSGIGRARVTISRAGMVPWTRDYPYVPASIDWDNTDGTGGNAGYGDFDVALEVWDVAGNHAVTHGTIHHIWPTPMPQPTTLGMIGVTAAEKEKGKKTGTVGQKEEAASLPRALPFWSLVLPLGALGVWLAASNAALAGDRRWSELHGIRRAVARYRDQNRINFSQGDEDD
jgi:hypothetical protein